MTDISRAILNITESKTMMEIEKKWLGNESRCSSPDASFSSNSLALENFWGLFMLVGIVALSAFIFCVVTFLHQNWHVVNQPHSTTQTKILHLIRKFFDKDPTYHAFNSTEIARQNVICCRCDCTNRQVESPLTNAPPSPQQQNNGHNLQENNNTFEQGEEPPRQSDGK